MKNKYAVYRKLRIALFAAGLLICSLALPFAAHAATGDIAAVRILNDGWMAEIDIEGFKDGGAYSFGIGANNDPANAKIVFTVTSQGYDSSGVLGTVTRTVYGTYWVRKAYPNEAQKDEVESGGNVTLKVALSDFIYDDDEAGAGKSGTDVSVSIGSGFYTDNGTGGSGLVSATTTNLSAANNSTLDYPKVIARWAWPGYERFESDFLVEAVAFHRFGKNGKPVAAIAFHASDQSGNGSHATATAMTVTTRTGDANAVQVYAGTMDIDALDQAEIIDVNFKAYPWVGDEDSVMNSRTLVDGVAQPDEYLGPLHAINDKDGTYGTAYAVVDPVNGNASAASTWVYPSQSAAEAAYASDNANSYTTIGFAVQAVKAYNNSNYSRNEPGAGTALLVEGNHNYLATIPASSLGAMNAWFTITKLSSAAEASTIINSGSNTASLKIPKVKVQDLSLATTSNGFMTGNGSADILWLHDNTINLTGSFPFHNFDVAYATQNSVTALGQGFASFGGLSVFPLVRGNNAASQLASSFYAVLGNRNISAAAYPEHGAGKGKPGDNVVYAFNSLYRPTTGAELNWAATTRTIIGIAVVQNLIETIDGTTAMLQMAATSGTATSSNHVIIWNNTFVGERTNFCYLDHGSTNYDFLNWSQKFNFFEEWNVKTDTFITQNANRVGNWSCRYNVGSVGNTSRQENFRGEFDGLFTRWGSSGTDLAGIDFASDRSQYGTDAGNGNYALGATSGLIDLATSTSAIDAVLPYDILGNLIYGPRDTGAYEYQPPYMMGTDNVSTSTAVRMYGNEKFRNRVTPSAAGTADLAVQIPGSDTAQWLDINVVTWVNAGNRHKAWTETTSYSGITDTVHTVGDLEADTYYNVKVDSVLGQNIVGAGCASGSCLSNGSGEISFTYTGSYSSHAFDVEEGGPIVSDVIVTPSVTGATIAWRTNKNASSSVGYGLTSSYGIVATSTGHTTHSVDLSGLSGDTVYHYWILAADSLGNVSTTTDRVFTTSSSAASAPAQGSAGSQTAIGGYTPSQSPQAIRGSQSQVSQGVHPQISVENPGERTDKVASRNGVPASTTLSGFERSLRQNMRGGDVLLLQRFLNRIGFPVSSRGAGSPGKETETFGPSTRVAIQRFQLKYRIVKDSKDSGYGIFGPKTKAKANELLSGL